MSVFFTFAFLADAADAHSLPFNADTDTERITLSGTLTDAQTGEPLIAASIQLEGTFRGAITNRHGAFEITVDELPAVLVFRYIGYETARISFSDEMLSQDVGLIPSTVELEELVFTGEDPAMHIMERVIARKQIWRESLQSWRAEAYTRNTLSNDEGIVSITESLTETWWKKDAGFREYVLDQRQTSNLLAEQNFSGTRNLPNFYDDEITVAGFRVIGVTHPNAFRYYDFKIDGMRQIDGDIVYDILVIPKTRLQPVFEGRISVLGSAFALLEVDLKPGEMIFFPPPVRDIRLAYKQQFSNYGSDFWLPADVRVSGLVDIGIPGFRIPEIRFEIQSTITNYEVNPVIPDTVFGDTSRQASRLIRLNEEERQRLNRGFEQQPQIIPLSDPEKEAYASIDSTQTLQDAFQPTGFLARFADQDGGDPGSDRSSRGIRQYVGIQPDARFNRVESLYAGAEIGIRPTDGLRVGIPLGYAVGPEIFSYGANVSYNRFLPANRLQMRVSYRYGIKEQVSSETYSPFLNSFMALLSGEDYFNYYLRESASVSLVYRLPIRLFGLTIRPNAGFMAERGVSLAKNTNYSLPGGFLKDENPAIRDGIIYAWRGGVRLGGLPTPFGISGNTSVQLKLEHSNKAMGSAFDYSRAEILADFRIPTFFQRRFLSNTLDVRIHGFTHTGDLPPQRWGGLDGHLGPLTVFGGLRSAGNKIHSGDHGLGVFWEHNFRTVPFELLGMQRLARTGLGILVHGASGKVWAPEDAFYSSGLAVTSPFNSWRHEAGVSLNNIFSIFRIDAGLRLDQPGYYLGVSASRIF
ncbi:MAG: DUF5686 and carboxypeptidase regulatory-like domain-containing protein [Balneolales bacterium]|nr:DUF5686 and carboxypeptidase regulatory-like domain-containing protein [Balneolales bacterium]